MGNSNSYPEAMLALKSVADVNKDIEKFNQEQKSDKARESLGFLVEFEKLNEKGFGSMLLNFFFQNTLSKTDIRTKIHTNQKEYIISFKIREMYNLAELLSRYMEDAPPVNHPEANNQDLRENNNNNNEESKNNENASAQLHELTKSKLLGQSQTEGKTENQTDDFDETLCPLCLDERIKIILPCMHGYCDGCARKWIQEKQKKTCPVCRFQIEMTLSKFNRTVTCIEDDYQNINAIVKQEIIKIILDKNSSIPLESHPQKQQQQQQKLFH